MADPTVGAMPERATEAILLKLTPSERQRINAAALASGRKVGPFIKSWMAQVCKSLEAAEQANEEA